MKHQDLTLQKYWNDGQKVCAYSEMKKKKIISAFTEPRLLVGSKKKKKRKQLRKWSSGLSQEERQSAKMPCFKFMADFRGCCCFKNGWIRRGALKRPQGRRSDSSSPKLHGSRALFNLVSPLYMLIILSVSVSAR